MKRVTLGFLIGSLLLLAATQVAWAAPPPSCPGIHYVRWGETLSHIAWRYGTTSSYLASINGIANPNRIYAGQRLTVPCGGSWHPPGGHWHPSGAGWYRVRHGDTLSGIAWRHGTTAWAIARANGIANPNRIYAGQRLHIPGYAAPPYHGAGWYTVRWGDTLSSIAWRHGTTVWAIANANSISNTNYIYAGQRLYIP
jgi:putative chitinase